MFLLFLLAGAASAAVEMSGLTNGKVAFDVNYKALDEDDDNTEKISLGGKTLTFLNNGNASENVQLELLNIASGYTLNLSASSFALNSNASQTVTINGQIPLSEDSGVHTIGQLRFGSTTYDIIANVESMLDLVEVVVYADGNKENTISNENEDTDDLRPGMEVELRFEIENLFDKDYDNGDIDINELTVKLNNDNDEDDYGDEIDEEPRDSFDELEAGEKVEGEDIVVVLSIPAEAKEGSYELEINLEGEDGNNAKHTVTWLVSLVIDREKDDVQFETVELTDSSIKCGETTYLNLELTNYGSNNQDKAAVSVYNQVLGINENYVNIKLDKNPEDSDNSFSKRIPITVNNTVKAGDYHIEVRSFLNNNKEKELRDVKLTVEKCSAAVPVVADEEEEAAETTGEAEEDLTETATGDEDDSEVVETTENEIPITSGAVIQTVEDPYSIEDFMVATLIIAFVLVIAMIVIFVVILVK